MTYRRYIALTVMFCLCVVLLAACGRRRGKQTLPSTKRATPKSSQTSDSDSETDAEEPAYIAEPSQQIRDFKQKLKDSEPLRKNLAKIAKLENWKALHRFCNGILPDTMLVINNMLRVVSPRKKTTLSSEQLGEDKPTTVVALLANFVKTFSVHHSQIKEHSIPDTADPTFQELCELIKTQQQVDTLLQGLKHALRVDKRKAPKSKGSYDQLKGVIAALLKDVTAAPQ